MQTAEVSQVLKVLKGAYPRQAMTKETAEVYVRCLRDLDAELCQAAILNLVSSSKWMPTISEIRQAVNHMSNNLPTAGEAWAEVVHNARTEGHRGSPQWSNPVTERAANAIGFKDFCLSNTSEEMAWRAHFLKIYDTLAERYSSEVVRIPESRQLQSRAMDRLQIGETAKRLGTGDR